jgi:hypothetical protein
MNTSNCHYLVAAAAIAIAAPLSHAAIIFSENMGTPSGTTAIASNTFQNSGTLTFGGTGDVRNTTTSTGYTGSSAGGNIFLTTGGTRDFTISAINTSAYAAGTLDISFGALKSTTASNLSSDFTLAYSTNGTTYTSILLPAQPTGAGTTGWRLMSLVDTALPITSTLYLRWTNTSATNQVRLDDVILQGDIASSSYFWVGADSTRGGSGTWSQANGTAWATSDADVAGGAWDETKTATFGGSEVSSAVTVSGTVNTTKGIAIASTGYLFSGGTINLGGATTDNNTITVATGSATIQSTLTGNTGMIKAGAGNLVLEGTHTYSGQTTVSGGSLILSSGASLSNTNVVVTNAGLSTGSTASVGGTVTANSGAVINAGGTGQAGTLNAGGMSFATGSTLSFDIGADLINLGAGALNVTGGTINFSGSAAANTPYQLFTAGSKTGVDFTTGTKPTGVGSAVYSFNSGVYSVTFNNRGVGSNFAGFTGTYSQNFDTLANSGDPSSTLPGGVAMSTATYTVSDGSGDILSGAAYSFGSASSTDRALGEISSGSTIAKLGINLKNNSAEAITQLRVRYTGEVWRTVNSGDDKLIFEYSTDAESLTTGTWVGFTALDFFGPDATNGTATGLDGNLAVNQTQFDEVIAGLNIAIGDGFWLRWSAINAGGTDSGLAIDNVIVSVPEPASLSLLAFGGLGLLRRRRRKVTA